MRRGVVTSVLLACTLVSGCSTLKPLTEPQPTPTVSASKIPQGIDVHRPGLFQWRDQVKSWGILVMTVFALKWTKRQ